ncbi:hypothetical protein BRADI_3g22023v3 [Brachypodium distachyon]|uniref:Secreted protein n=1 Tax=Brachypodium distachyon TaxID=15368 RepID=A0A0Q3HRY6_BRADI|nr:hypothetical protein BRADI_3g22023v3 [Brachypodium distachyon]
MKTPCTKSTAVAAIFSALLLLFLCISSSLPHKQSSVLRNRRLLLQCGGASSCSTRLDRFSQLHYRTPKAVFQSSKRMPKTRANPSHN